MTLGITTLLSMTVFLMVIGESMPPTSEKLPLIGDISSDNNKPFVWCLCEGLYYGVTISLVSLATGLSVVTLNLHHRGLRGRRWLWPLLWWLNCTLSFKRVPPSLRFIVFKVLAKILMMKMNITEKKRPRTPTESSSPLYNQQANCCICQAQQAQLDSNK